MVKDHTDSVNLNVVIRSTVLFNGQIRKEGI